MLPVSNCKTPARSGTPGNVTRVDMDRGGSGKWLEISVFGRTIPLNTCTNEWHSPLKSTRVILPLLPTPCHASLVEILSAVYDNVFSLPMHRQERQASLSPLHDEKLVPVSELSPGGLFFWSGDHVEMKNNQQSP